MSDNDGDKIRGETEDKQKEAECKRAGGRRHRQSRGDGGNSSRGRAASGRSRKLGKKMGMPKVDSKMKPHI